MPASPRRPEMQRRAPLPIGLDLGNTPRDDGAGVPSLFVRGPAFMGLRLSAVSP